MKKHKSFLSDSVQTEPSIEIRVDAFNEHRNAIGIHLLNPIESEIEQAKERAIGNGFKIIYCHYTNVFCLDNHRKVLG